MFLSIFTTIEIFILLFISENYFKIFSDTARMNTFFFTAIMFFGLFMPLIIRERDHFWSSRPGRTLMISIVIDVVAVSILSTLGLGLLKPVTMDEYIFILIYTIFSTFIINDLAKIMLEKFGLSR